MLPHKPKNHWADRLMNRLLGLCNGLHFGYAKNLDKKGRNYIRCIVCGKAVYVQDEK